MRSKLATNRLIAVILFLAAVTPANGQWPQFGGLNRDFRALEQSKPAPRQLTDWSIELGLGDAAPVVDQNKIFVSDAAYTADGQEAMQVRCIDLVDGKPIWSTLVREKSFVSQDISDSYPVRPLASPIASAGRIVVVSYGGCVSCLDQNSGTVAWMHDLVTEFKAPPLQFGWASSPWSDGTNVVVACGGPAALVIAFSLDTGKLAWQLSSGEAAFASFSEVVSADGSKHLCYLGRDILIGFDPSNGNELWNYPLPKPGLTNAVTPISLPNGQLLVAGQGFGSTRRLQISNIESKWIVNEVWMSKNSPFYCNWLVDNSTQQIFGYNSNVLAGIDLATGDLKWKARNWTDTNFAIKNDTIVGIRGDGFLAKANITKEGMNVFAGSRIVNDRVWAPPVIVENTVLIRGRRTLSAVDLDSLPLIDKLPSGTAVDAMNAMYGQNHENIVALLEKGSKEPDKFSYEDYHSVVADRSVRFGEGEYRKLLDALAPAGDLDLQIQIAEDWNRLEPNSIVAFDKWIELLGKQNQNAKVENLLADRLIEVEIEVSVPKSTDPKANIYLTGNAAVVHSWKPDGWLLTRSENGRFRTKLKLPKGNFEFKLTQGDWESVEVRSDGRSTSNRRLRVIQATNIQPPAQFEVQAWKNDTNR
jgi:outer membrane protein assembly factor BamB